MNASALGQRFVLFEKVLLSQASDASEQTSVLSCGGRFSDQFSLLEFRSCLT
jgi:hypothetical protein